VSARQDQKTGFELPDADLAWQVRAWGRWVLERAKADLANRYPTVNGEPTVAYLWARTARDRITGGRIPLLKTFWLRRKKGKRSALLPIPKPDGTEVSFQLLTDADMNAPSRLLAEYPHLDKWGVTPESLESFLDVGTMNKAGVWSPFGTGRPGIIALTMDNLRTQGQQNLLGAQMTAVVVESTVPGSKKTAKNYRLPVQQELEAAKVEIEELEAVFEDLPFGLPDEPLPPVGTLGFRIPLYGFKKWRDIFTPRQFLVLGIFLQHTHAAIQKIVSQNVELTTAIGACLCLAIDRLADYSSALCTWHNRADKMRNTFGRFALPMVWDFAEVNPCSNTSGNYTGAIEWISLYIAQALQATRYAKKPTVKAQSAMTVGSESFAVVQTDPPYYGAIPYSDLMDFFYIWLRRSTKELSPEIDANFESILAPKWNTATNDGELIDDESRFGGDKAKSKSNYETGMARAFKASLEYLPENGRIVIVFANKEVDAWETLIAALIQSGAAVSASWPIQTEMTNRTRGISSAALSSSVWIVCRKRLKTAQPGWDSVVLEKMKQSLFGKRDSLGQKNTLEYFFDLGIRGPDFIWAAMGPALEAYSAHPYVKKTDGGMMTVQDFLKEVRKLVLQFSLGELPGFKDLQQQTHGRGDAVALDPVTQYYLLHRAFFSLTPAPAGACILYANACGKTDRELQLVWNVIEQGGKGKKLSAVRKEAVSSQPSAISAKAAGDEELDDGSSESKGNEYRLVDWWERAKKDGLGENRSGGSSVMCTCA